MENGQLNFPYGTFESTLHYSAYVVDNNRSIDEDLIHALLSPDRDQRPPRPNKDDVIRITRRTP